MYNSRHNRYKIETNCLSTDEEIKKMWFLNTMEYYSTIKRINSVIFNNMEETEGHHVKWNMPDIETNSKGSYSHVEYKKIMWNIQNPLFELLKFREYTITSKFPVIFEFCIPH